MRLSDGDDFKSGNSEKVGILPPNRRKPRKKSCKIKFGTQKRKENLTKIDLETEFINGFSIFLMLRKALIALSGVVSEPLPFNLEKTVGTSRNFFGPFFFD